MTRRRKPSAKPVVAGSVAGFFALFGFLTYELGIGHDPALSKQAQAAVRPAAKRVVVKRIEHRLVVTRVVPTEQEDDGPVVQTQAQPAAAAPTGPASAPAPAPAQSVVVQPAPAAAAPVVTRSS